MRALVPILGFVLLASVGCKGGKRAEAMEGTWYGYGFTGGGSNAGVAKKFAITFNSDGTYSTTAKCFVDDKRHATFYRCDDSKPMGGKYVVRKIERNRISLRWPPAGDDLEFVLEADGTAKFRMWQKGFFIKLARTQAEPGDDVEESADDEED